MARDLFEKTTWRGGPYMMIGYLDNEQFHYQGFDQVFLYNGQFLNAGGLDVGGCNTVLLRAPYRYREG